MNGNEKKMQMIKSSLFSASLFFSSLLLTFSLAERPETSQRGLTHHSIRTPFIAETMKRRKNCLFLTSEQFSFY